MGLQLALFDSSLSLEVQFSTVVRGAFADFKLLCQLHLFLEMSDMAMVTHTLLTSHSDYCNNLCG